MRALPQIILDATTRWGLSTGAPFRSESEGAAWVAPVTDRLGRSAVLKVSFPHFEEQHEIEGLRFWNGDPTVRLLASDDERHVLLLERCSPGTDLRELPESEQDCVIAGLLRRLWRRPEPEFPFRPLEAMLEYWSKEAKARIAHARDPGLVYEGLALFQELARSAERRVLLATDLHAGNVLRAHREAWLVIDPKPFVGDPAYDATQHLLNCVERLIGDPTGVTDRFAEALQVCPRRIRLWTFARAAVATACEDHAEADHFRSVAAALRTRI